MNIFSKAVVSVSAISFLLALSAGAETPGIERAGVWPDSVEHNSDVYVDATVGDSAEDVWFEATSGSEKVAKASMFDTNNDGYYTSASSFNVEGGQKYSVTVVAYSNSGEKNTEEILVRPECRIDFIGNCLY